MITLGFLITFISVAFIAFFACYICWDRQNSAKDNEQYYTYVRLKDMTFIAGCLSSLAAITCWLLWTNSGFQI